MSSRKRRLLCFDGGGVRGLSSLYILKQLMESINYENPPKPCEVFDMIGGTSTGGLIAIMLGRLEMTVDQCIEKYRVLSDSVFRRQHMFAVNLRGRVQPRFRTADLQQAIQDIITQSTVIEGEGTGVNAVMRKETPSGCRTFVTALSGEFGDYRVVFSSYGRPGESNRALYDSAKIWEAARATSAASSFFDPIQIGAPSQTFLDGAVGQNNPVTVLWDEARRIWPPAPGQTMESTVECLVSIGTGVPSPEPFGESLKQVYNTLKRTATETENTAGQFVRDHGELVRQDGYYRFNVTHGLGDVGLEEADRAGVIAAATARYGDDPGVQLMLHKLVEKAQALIVPPSDTYVDSGA
ncbi:MAG: hypothetical protein M1821_009710 [Bathelium mastoideum]|nr:MAG: hypothetical protein M1821_009710 [Bathelium mastoideum]